MMNRVAATSRFKAKLLRPAELGTSDPWTFVVLPKPVSDTLPRRGRTTVEGTINGYPFQATLEPDGQRSHWLKVSQELRTACGAAAIDTVELVIAPVAREPEPVVPTDLRDVLAASPEARKTWDATTTIARIDWIHWIESAKQAATRERRVENAGQMLASGKKRVCCFDQSGFYDKSLSAPEPAE